MFVIWLVTHTYHMFVITSVFVSDCLCVWYVSELCINFKEIFGKVDLRTKNKQVASDGDMFGQKFISSSIQTCIAKIHIKFGLCL